MSLIYFTYAVYLTPPYLLYALRCESSTDDTVGAADARASNGNGTDLVDTTDCNSESSHPADNGRGMNVDENLKSRTGTGNFCSEDLDQGFRSQVAYHRHQSQQGQ